VTRPLLDGLNGLLVVLEGASVVVVEKLMRLRVKPGFFDETSSWTISGSSVGLSTFCRFLRISLFRRLINLTSCCLGT